MKKTLALVALLTAVTVAVPMVFAVDKADQPTPAVAKNVDAKPERRGPPKTRQEAIERAEKGIQRAKDRLTKLQSMTDAEWKAEQDKRAAERKERRAKKGSRSGAPAEKQQ